MSLPRLRQDEEEFYIIKKKFKEELLQYTDSEHIITVQEVRKSNIKAS